MDKFKKGDIVYVSAMVRVAYANQASPEDAIIHKPPRHDGPYVDGVKSLYRYTSHWPIAGLVIGECTRATGLYFSDSFRGEPYPDPPYLAQDKRHKLIMVEPIDSDRWVEPWLCLEADLKEGRND